MSCTLTESVGAYLLGAVDDREHAQLDAHVRVCADCRAVADELRPVSAILRKVQVDDLTAPEPPADGLDRLLATHAAARRRHGVRRLVAAAVLVAAAAVTAGVVGAGEPAGDPSVDTVAVTASDATGGVTATAWLADRAWGTEIRLRLTGVAEGEWCQLVVRDHDGGTETAASWTVQYGEDVDVPGATATRLPDISELTVVTSDGARLVSLPTAGGGM